MVAGRRAKCQGSMTGQSLDPNRYAPHAVLADLALRGALDEHLPLDIAPLLHVGVHPSLSPHPTADEKRGNRDERARGTLGSYDFRYARLAQQLLRSGSESSVPLTATGGRTLS